MDMYRSDRLSIAEMAALIAAVRGTLIPGGTTVRVSHTDCPAGEDRRDRVYITRDAGDHTFLVYCHNCGRGGRYNLKVTKNYRTPSVNPAIPGKSTLVQKQSLWDLAKPLAPESKHRAWLEGFGLTSGDIVNYNFRYSDSLARLLMPTYDDENDVSGFQARTLDPANPAKYITYPFIDPLPLTHCGRVGADRPLVVCEDLVSMVKVYYRLDVPATALLTSTCKTDRLLPLAKEHSRTYIWLDNDNPEVIKHGQRLTESLKLAGVDARWVGPPHRDPKRHTVAEINNVIGVK